MRAVLQRVTHASVTINGERSSSIGQGYLVLLGCENADTEEDIQWLSKKICNLRVFDDENGVMNKSILDVGGEILVVSQFTLWASYKKGNHYPTLRTLLYGLIGELGQAGSYWRIWCRDEGGTAERRSCDHLYGYKKQRIT